MIRAAVFGLVVVLVLSSGWCLAQEVAGTGEAAETELPLPDFGSRMVAGESVVDLADFLANHVDATGAVPELAQVRTLDGALQSLSAAEAFVLLARTTYLWRATGDLPETVPISPDQVSAPVLDPEDAVSPPDNPDLGREIPTEKLLAQCAAVVQWIDRLQVIPTAVWVDGQRLSAAEYVTGLAICVSYAYWEGQLYESVFLPPYAPPRSWTGEEAGYYQAEASQYAKEYQPEAAEAAFEPAAEAGSEEEYPTESEEESYLEYAQAEEPYQEEEAWQETTEEDLGEAWEEGSSDQWEEEWAPESEYAEEEYYAGPEEYPAPELYGESEEYAEPEESVEPEEPSYQGRPSLSVFPEPGSDVSGIVDLVVSYSGPAARFVIFKLDGKDEVMMNSLPYSCRWDTSGLERGPHTVRVQVLGDEDALLADQTSAYTVVPPAELQEAPGK